VLLESQRDCVLQPRVARHELPWVCGWNNFNPNGVAARDRAGALWIGSEFGLFRWAEGKLKRFTSADGFSAAYVLSLAEDAAGAIWIGTAVGELRRYQDGKFQTFRPADSPGGTNVLAGEQDIDPMLSRGRGALSGGERFWALHFDSDGVVVGRHARRRPAALRAKSFHPLHDAGRFAE
jgi:ligand-binding sensor domain-containing protein